MILRFRLQQFIKMLDNKFESDRYCYWNVRYQRMLCSKVITLTLILFFFKNGQQTGGSRFFSFRLFLLVFTLFALDVQIKHFQWLRFLKYFAKPKKKSHLMHTASEL